MPARHGVHRTLSVQLFAKRRRNITHGKKNKPELAIAAAVAHFRPHYPSNPEVPAALLEARTLSI